MIFNATTSSTFGVSRVIGRLKDKLPTFGTRIIRTDLRIALGADHAGIGIKNAIRDALLRQKIEHFDFGTYVKASCHYPEFAYKVAEAVAAGKFNFAFLSCSTGEGMGMASNDVPGVRAAIIYSSFTARRSRKHNNANVFCMGGETISKWKALRLMALCLNTPFLGEPRNVLCLEMIENGPAGFGFKK